MFKRIAAAVGVALLPLAFAAPAFAWHIEGVQVECSEQDAVLTVAVSLTDNGPGTYSDTEGKSGTFGAVDEFAYQLSTYPTSLTVHVAWNKGTPSPLDDEHAQFTAEEIPECFPTTTTVPPTTTTTVVETTTTTVPTSTTTPSDTTTIPAPPTSVPIISAPGAELASTGGGELAIGAGLGLSILLLGAWLAARGRQA